MKKKYLCLQGGGGVSKQFWCPSCLATWEVRPTPENLEGQEAFDFEYQERSCPVCKEQGVEVKE